jgi:hypothetical protein
MVTATKQRRTGCVVLAGDTTIYAADLASAVQVLLHLIKIDVQAARTAWTSEADAPDDLRIE